MTTARRPLSSADEILRDLCDFLSLYPAASGQQILDAVLTLRSDADAREFTIHCLLAERAVLIERLETAGVLDIGGTSLDEVKRKGMPL